MIGYLKLPDNKENDKNYYCSNCGAFIADSGSLIVVQGSNRHSFVNPAGVRCNFITLRNCENVLVHEGLFLEHSWFPKYGWRFVVCAACMKHLGWRYDPADEHDRSEGFFGILVDSVTTVDKPR